MDHRSLSPEAGRSRGNSRKVNGRGRHLAKSIVICNCAARSSATRRPEPTHRGWHCGRRLSPAPVRPGFYSQSNGVVNALRIARRWRPAWLLHCNDP